MNFVIHLHKAKGEKFYLRLEKDGVLKNWAVPKGLPDYVGIKRLAVQIRDGQLSVAGFEGPISKGEFGRGVVSIWDKGSYAPISWQPDKICFHLQGAKYSGTYSMERFSKAGENCWTISKVEAQSLKPPPPPASVAAKPKIRATRKQETKRPRRSQSPTPRIKKPFFPKRKGRWRSGPFKSSGGRPSLGTWWMR